MTAQRKAPKRSRRVSFTARAIGRLAPEAYAVDWFDTRTPGLALHVTPAGARTWYLFYRKGRTTRRVKLGRYSDKFGLAKARADARETRVRVEKGADPAYERREARDVFTVGDLAKLYLEQHAKAHKKTWKDDRWRLDRYILPAWRSRPVAEIMRGDVHTLIDKIAGDGKPIQANRVLALVSKVWNVAIDRGHAAINPAHRMPKAAPERARATVLDDAALKALWQALDAQPGDAADAVRLRLLLGQRGGEVHRMAWAEVELKAAVWTIPAAKAKNRRAHRVPLSTPAVDVLKARLKVRPKDETNVFPGLYHQRKDLRALGTIHHGAYKWHDLRRTVATRLAALGIPEAIIGACLNHAKRGVTATVYQMYDYDLEKRQALDVWARELNDIVTGKPKRGAVVPMRGRA